MKHLGLTLMLLFWIPIFLGSSCDNETTNGTKKACIDKNCKDYTSRTSAQADFDADPDCRNDLDADKDGIACEEPGNEVSSGGTIGTGGTQCPTTSNCGCSNKNKSECETSTCCKWVVGDGCRCK